MAKIPEAVLKKIQKLLSLASDKSTTSHEASAASARAQELLKKNNLDLSEFLSMSAEELDVVERDITDPRGVRAFGNWKRVLLSNISRLFGVHAFKTKQGLRVIGKKENTERVVHYFEYLSAQVELRSNKGWIARKAVLELSNSMLLSSRRYGVIWKNNAHFSAIQILEDRLKQIFGIQEQDEEFEEPKRTRPQREPDDEDQEEDDDQEDENQDDEEEEQEGNGHLHETTALVRNSGSGSDDQVVKYIEKKYETKKNPLNITMTLDRDGWAYGRLIGRSIDLQLAVYAGELLKQLHASTG